MTEWKSFRNELLSKDEDVRREYERLGPIYDVISEAIRVRRLRGLSQEQLAEKMGKQQSAIARLEAGRVVPSFAFLRELAEALDMRLTVRLEPQDSHSKSDRRPVKKGAFSAR